MALQQMQLGSCPLQCIEQKKNKKKSLQVSKTTHLEVWCQVKAKLAVSDGNICTAVTPMHRLGYLGPNTPLSLSPGHRSTHSCQWEAGPWSCHGPCCCPQGVLGSPRHGQSPPKNPPGSTRGTSHPERALCLESIGSELVKYLQGKKADPHVTD